MRWLILGVIAVTLPLQAPVAGAGSHAPPFSVRALDGKVLRLSDLRGRPVLIDFWATWCVPCRAAMPGLQSIQDRYGPRGLVVVGLSMDDAHPRVVKQYAERLGVRFPVAMADDRILTLYGPIRSIPTTVFIDREGRIARRVTGFLDSETMEAFAAEIVRR